MKHSVWVVLFLLVGTAAVVCLTVCLRGPLFPGTASAQAVEQKNEDQKPKGLPPLVVDKSAPLLLEDPPEEDPWDIPTGPVADNIACYCCHANYEEEPFVVYHAKANVGCVKCHGESYDHGDDEDNITPPDVMFPPEKIESNCRECHETHDAPAQEVIARWQERCPDKAKPEEILCMDCHGKHRLESRTVRWDKRTGKLIIRVKVEDVEKAAEESETETPRSELKIEN
jgi:hypothetical protein